MAGLVFDPTTAAGWRPVQAGDIPSGAGSPLTTKGDLYGYGSGNARVPVGANGYVLTADSAQALGVKWAAPAASGISQIASPTSTITVTNPTGPTADVDLPTTGVAAGSYGSSTQSAAITVDAEGRITAASNQSISGIAGTGLVKLFEQVLGSAAASLDTGASGIASGHGDLVIYVIARSATAAATDSWAITVNGDTGANYDNERVQANNVTASAANSTAQTNWAEQLIGNTGTANYASVLRIDIPAYDLTTFFKVCLIHSAELQSSAGNCFTSQRGGGWRSTAAINQITLKASSGANLQTGSRLVVYGTQ